MNDDRKMNLIFWVLILFWLVCLTACFLVERERLSYCVEVYSGQAVELEKLKEQEKLMVRQNEESMEHVDTIIDCILKGEW